MERAFALQERAIALPIPKATVSLFKSSQMVSPQLSSKSKSTVYSSGLQSQDAVTQNLTSELESFPYCRLLTLWRQNALKLMLQHKLTESKFNQSVYENRRTM